MKILYKTLNIIGVIVGILFILAGGTDIQLGFGCVLVLLGASNLLRPHCSQ